ncbi:MerR family transcriptional regulator [Chelatococcus reniformis]|uniref:MerR family transcriptional regulator n=1 Tax=Chelatococcus reniformis TaxID=1494448 RepID=UPI001FCEAC2C|nr:MerR family transcriptional regulator [Chelatococcus reniformis]
MTDKSAVEKSADAFRTISEVADELNVPQHVLRFWESRFAQIKPLKRGGGRRFYRPDDVDLIRGIRHLLYGEGYTIRGVQRILKDEGVRFVQTAWREGWVAPEVGRAQAAHDAAADPVRPRDVAVEASATEPISAAQAAAVVRREPDMASGGSPGEGAVDQEGEGAAGFGLNARHQPATAPQRAAVPMPAGLESLWSAAPARAGATGPDAPLYGEGMQARAESPRAADRLSPEGRRRLQEALAELIECRRLLTAARAGGSD